MNKLFFERYARWMLVLFALTTPLVFVGVRGALRGSSNDVRQWLPAGFQETKQYDWFLKHFGSEEIAVVSWPGATLDDPRVERMAEGLRRWSDAELGVSEFDPSAPVPLFRRVLTGQELLDDLTAEPLNLSREEALRRLEGTLVGPNGETSGLVIAVNQAGAADRHAAVDTISRVAREEAGLTDADLRMGGPTIDSVSLDKESQRMRYALSAGSVLLALALAWRCLRQIKLVAIVFATALYCAAASMAVVHYTGGTMSLVLVTMPTMIFVLTISGSIHMVHYYRTAIVKQGLEGAPRRMLAAAWLPCALTAFTTAVGLASLGVSEVIPVKQFGIYSSVGVVLSVPVLFLFLPSALQMWPVPPSRHVANESATADRQERSGGDIGHGWSGHLAGFVVRRHAWITAIGLAAMLFALAGLFRLETTVKLLSMFSPQSRILQDYAWLETNLGPLVPIEVVVRFDNDHDMPLLARLDLIRRVQQQVAEIDKVGGTMSIATFTPPVPEGRGISHIVRRSVIERRLMAAMEDGGGDAYVRASDEGQLWRVSARVEALNSLDYGYFTAALREQVDPLLEAAAGSGIEATYTGVVPLVYKAQRALLNDLTSSFLTAFVLIGVVMLVTLRRMSSGLVSMLPNVFPALIIFGIMGWTGRLCDIGSMMTASIALGIAVDDTIHFLTWFRRGLNQGLSRPRAIQFAYDHCARAMLQTTIICGLGLLVFAFSSFVPTARFSSMLFLMLVTAVVGDLLFLPSLLAGPLGRFFEVERAPGRVARRLGLGRGTSLIPVERPAISVEQQPATVARTEAVPAGAP